jgi:two-component SAPR family response regulator
MFGEGGAYFKNTMLKPHPQGALPNTWKVVISYINKHIEIISKICYNNSLMPNTLIQIKLFGTFDILCEGKSVFTEETRRQRPFEILRYMLANDGRDLLPETMVGDIWHNKGYTDPRNIIRTYIFRLKRFLSQENALHIDLSRHFEVISIKGHYRIITEDTMRDAELFDKCVNAVDLEDGMSRKADYILRMMDLFQSEYLSDMVGTESDWALTKRVMYRKAYMERVGLLLETLWQKGDNKAVIDLCERALKLYSACDRINAYYLKALNAEGRIDFALEHYTNVTKNVNPSKEMRKVYALLRAGLGDGEIWHTVYDIMDRQETSALGCISIGTGEGGALAMDILCRTLSDLLRLDEMYAPLSETEVLVMFKNIREEHYPRIISRIKVMFRDACAESRIEPPMLGIRLGVCK